MFAGHIGAALAIGRVEKSGRFRSAALVGAAVFSHWLLDALVHVPELPLLGADSTKVDLGLWQSMPAPPSAMAMAGSSLATLIVVGGVYCWLGRSPK